jgi:hypothetical protein
MKTSIRVVSVGLLLLVGCKRNPIDRLIDPVPSEAQPFPATGGRYTVYDDELKTGGGLGLIPGGQNQTINLNYTDSSRPGRQIVYAWNGNDVSSMTSVSQHAFAGFELLVTDEFPGLLCECDYAACRCGALWYERRTRILIALSDL